MLAYLVQRQRATPQLNRLLILSYGTNLTRQKLVASLRSALKAIGLDSQSFSGHSFRIGAAAASAGLSDTIIQHMGRWRSNAFRTYIQPEIALVAPALLCWQKSQLISFCIVHSKVIVVFIFILYLIISLVEFGEVSYGAIVTHTTWTDTPQIRCV